MDGTRGRVVSPADRAWLDQLNAHIAVTVEACRAFVDVWDGGETTPRELMLVSRDLVEAAARFDALMHHRQGWEGEVPGVG